MNYDNVGLVLEGGAMRGMFTAGVLDILMENDLYINNCVGVSAGAVFGCNYKSRQIGRTIRYNKRFCRNWRYCSLRSWLLTGNIYGADFGYRRLPDELDVFDRKTFQESPVNFYVGATNMISGKCDFFKSEKGDAEDLLWYRASASMPVVSRIVMINGTPYLDGGSADSIPLDFMEGLGFSRNVVLLTQPEGFVKQPNSMLPLIRMKYGRKYPLYVKVLEERHNVYNRTLAVIREKEKEGTVFAIRPPEALNIKSVVHDPDELERVYRIGRAEGARILPSLKDFLEK